MTVAIAGDGRIKHGDTKNVPIQMIFCMKVSPHVNITKSGLTVIFGARRRTRRR